MKKTYMQPTTDVIIIETVHMLAASGDDLTGVKFSDTELGDVTFGSRGIDFDDEEY